MDCNAVYRCYVLVSSVVSTVFRPLSPVSTERTPWTSPWVKPRDLVVVLSLAGAMHHPFLSLGWPFQALLSKAGNLLWKLFSRIIQFRGLGGLSSLRAFTTAAAAVCGTTARTESSMHIKWTFVLDQHFSNLTVHTKHLGIVLKCRFWFTR